jgi:hypothetical protein
MSKYEFTKEMREISGLGDSYEAACRTMVIRGAEWLDEHPNADPHFSGYKNVYGIIYEDNDDAKSLIKAMVEAAIEKHGDSPTGAMVQATVSHVMHIAKNDWDKYAQEMTKNHE